MDLPRSKQNTRPNGKSCACPERPAAHVQDPGIGSWNQMEGFNWQIPVEKGDGCLAVVTGTMEQGGDKSIQLSVGWSTLGTCGSPGHHILEGCRQPVSSPRIDSVVGETDRGADVWSGQKAGLRKLQDNCLQILENSE